MFKQSSMAAIAAASLMTSGDILGNLHGTKHKGSKKPMDVKVAANRKKEKAAKKARSKNR